MKFRFSVMTLNLWNTEKLSIRKNTICKFFEINKPDFLCIQEIRPETEVLLDSLLPGYARVHDNFCGWNEESNIYYNLELFEEIEHGRIDLFMPEINRGLFYLSVRCKVNNDTLFISTVHLTHQGNAYEVSTGKSYRHDEAVRLSDAIIKLTKENEGALICGDFNDPFLPLKIIHDKTGFNEVFNTLHLAAPVTFSCTQISDDYGLTESIDKIVANKILRPIMATSPRIVTNTGLSDHYPVEAMFEVTK